MPRGFRQGARSIAKNTDYRSTTMPRFIKGTGAAIRQPFSLPWVSHTFSLSGTTGGLIGVTYAVNLNGLYDPWQGVGGTQPMGFDQWMAFYLRYKVTAVEVLIRAMPVEGALWSTTAGSFIAFQVKNSSLAPTAVITGADYATVKQRAQGDALFVDITNKGGNQKAMSLSMATIEGKPLWSDNYSGSATGNPGNLIQLELGVGNANGLDASTCNCIVEVRYKGYFYERASLPIS